MRRKHLVTIALVILGIAVLGLLAIPNESGPKEPTYKGKKLRKWVVLFINSDNGPQAQETVQAMQEMGSNSVPFLLQWMDYQPPPWRQKLLANTLRLLPFFRSFPSICDSISGSERGKLAFGSRFFLTDLKPPAAMVTNQLCRMLLEPESTASCRRNAAEALAGIESSPHEIVPIFLSAMRSSNGEIREAAGSGLNNYSYSIESDPIRLSTLPVLVWSLSDTNPRVICSSLSTLCTFRIDAENLRPALTNLLSHPSKGVRMGTLTAFEWIEGIHFPFTNAPGQRRARRL